MLHPGTHHHRQLFSSSQKVTLYQMMLNAGLMTLFLLSLIGLFYIVVAH